MSRDDQNEHNQKYTEWILSVLAELKENSFVNCAIRIQIITADEAIEVSGMVKESIGIFLDRIQKEELSLAQIGLSISKEQGIQQIQSLYKL